VSRAVYQLVHWRRYGNVDSRFARDLRALTITENSRLPVLRAGIVAALLVLTAHLASSMSYFRPPLPSGPPAGYVKGIFLERACGADGGGCGTRVRKDDGSQGVLSSVPLESIIVDGRSIFCMNSPPLQSQCDEWPKDVTPGKTRIRMPYWWAHDKSTGYTFPYTDRITTIK
jgi:hypothetical protein